MIKRITFTGFHVILLTCISLLSAYAGEESHNPDEASAITKQYEKNVFTVNAFVEKDSSGESEETGKNRFCKNVGTAFSFGYEGYLVTLHCVVADASGIVVFSQDGKKTFATLIDTSPAGRISVLKLDEPVDAEVPRVELGNVSEFDSDVILMNMIGNSVVALSGRLNDNRKPDGSFGIDAIASEATSGMPVFNRAGQLLGLLAMQVEDEFDLLDIPHAESTENTPHEDSFFAIPSEYIWMVSQSMINRHEGICGWLGIKTDIFDTDNHSGVVVTDVFADSPAEKFGLRSGDRIVSFNGGDTPRFRFLIEHLTKTKAGETVDLTIKRGETLEHVNVILARQPGD